MTDLNFVSSTGLGLEGSAMAFDPKGLTLVGRMTPHRRLPPELSKPVKEFSGQVGEAIWAWNYCHSAFCQLFTILVSPQNLLLGNALWHELQSDSAQRQLLLAAAQIALKKKPRMFARVKWAKLCADTLSRTRNDVAHMATAFASYPKSPVVVPSLHGTAPKRFRRLQDQDLHKTLALLRGDLIALGGYVMILSAELAFPGHYALPRRPRLHSAPPQNSKKTNRRKNTKRPAQRQSSQG